MSQDDERDNSLADDMLEPMRQRERERRGSNLSDEARFSLIARGELHTCVREGCRATVAYDGAEYCSPGCFEQDRPVRCICASPGLPGSEGPDPDCPKHGRPGLDPMTPEQVEEFAEVGFGALESDIPEDEATPECLVCGGGQQVEGMVDCPECSGSGEADPRDAPVLREDFDSLAAEYGFHWRRPELPALIEANERANARLYPELPPGVVREGGKLVHRAPRSPSEARELEAKQRRITLKMTLLRSAGILIGWKGDHFSLAESVLDAIIQLVAERDDLKQRLHRAAARCTLTAETISSLAAGDEE